MHSRSWISLLRRIPQEWHDSLVVVTSIGTEISVQSIIRMEDECLVLRGRLGGSSDAGRVFFIPFDDINHLLLQKEMKETDIQALYGMLPLKAPAASPQEPAKPQPPVETAAVQQPAAVNPPAAEPLPTSPPAVSPSVVSPPPSRQMPIPSKEKILERLRARVQASGSNKPSNL
jgi:hypothetical protein